MVEYNTEMEPIVVTSHDKGLNRGISLYFGLNEVDQLERQGIDLKKNRRFLVRATTDSKLILVPFSQLDFSTGMESQLDSIMDLEKDEQETIATDLLDLITEKKLELSATERAAILQITKEHYTRHNLRNLIQVGLRANKEATQALLKKYV